MKRVSFLLILLILALALCACGADDTPSKDAPTTVTPNTDGKLTVICSLFPQYDFTRAIAGAHAEVTQLLPLGIDNHEYEPSAREMLAIGEADLFIYTDSELEGWVDNVKGALEGVEMVRCADGIDLVALNEAWEAAGGAHEEDEHEAAHDGEDAHEHEHEHAYDAHIWLDPTLAIKMCENIKTALINKDPAHAADYEANCALYTEKLTQLDADIQSAISAHPGKTLYFGGKFAYSHFVRHYNLAYLSAYSSCSDEGEPGARVIVDMANKMRTSGAKVIFTDEMSSGAVAQALSEQTGAEVLLFHSCHNLSKDDAIKGLTYLDLMQNNLANIEKALK